MPSGRLLRHPWDGGWNEDVPVKKEVLNSACFEGGLDVSVQTT